MASFEKLPGVVIEEEEVDNRLPNFKVPPDLNLISRSGIDGYRLEQMKEIESIKERLARDHCPQSMVTL
jgi:hypothetical protein